eukprot:12199250-Heterocapsa_arctica.AAC.1
MASSLVASALSDDDRYKMSLFILANAHSKPVRLHGLYKSLLDVALSDTDYPGLDSLVEVLAKAMYATLDWKWIRFAHLHVRFALAANSDPAAVELPETLRGLFDCMDDAKAFARRRATYVLRAISEVVNGEDQSSLGDFAYTLHTLNTNDDYKSM